MGQALPGNGDMKNMVFGKRSLHPASAIYCRCSYCLFFDPCDYRGCPPVQLFQLLRLAGYLSRPVVFRLFAAFWAFACAIITAETGLLAFILLSLASVTVATISRMKMKYRGEPLLPWDFKLGGEALDVSTFFSFQAIFHTLLPIAVVLVIGLVMVWKLPSPNYRLVPRLILAVAGLVLVFGMFGGTMKARQVFALEAINWDQSMNYDQNGMVVGLLLSAQYMEVQEPKEYARDAVEAIPVTSPKLDHEAPKAPNIIMIMSEAFWDPTRLENVTFSRDPLQFFHQLERNRRPAICLCPSMEAERSIQNLKP